MPAVQTDLEELSGLIDLIYQGATEPERWDSTLAALSDYVEAPYALLLTPLHSPEAGGYMYSRQIPAGIFENWPRFLPHDIYAKEGLAQGVFQDGVVVTGEDIVPSERFESSVFYRDYLAHYGLRYMMAGVVFGNDNSSLLPTTCTLYRNPEASPFSDIQRQRLRLLMPHLSRALGVMQRLRGADMRVAASRTTLDLLRAGVLLIGAEGEVVFANRSSQSLLGQKDGLRLRVTTGANWLTASDPRIQRAIDAAVHTAVSPDILTMAPHFSRSIAVARPSRRAPYQLSFSSLSVENEFSAGSGAPRAIVFITDPEQPCTVDTGWLRSTYDLTRAETRVAALLVNGETAEEIAATIGVSVATIRTQLRQIYAKTGTGGRAKLMRLLISSGTG